MKGTDLYQLQQQGRFIFLDGFSKLFAPTSQTTDYKTITLTGEATWIDIISRVIMKAISEIKGRPALFIEGLDLLLAAGPDDISASQVLACLSLLSEVTFLHISS